MRTKVVTVISIPSGGGSTTEDLPGVRTPAMETWRTSALIFEVKVQSSAGAHVTKTLKEIGE